MDTLLRRPFDSKPYRDSLYRQACLYPSHEFGEFDGYAKHWIPAGGNRGLLIQNHSRADFAIDERDKYLSGSTFASAKPRAQQVKIESRDHIVRIRLNGGTVSKHPGDPQRSKTGPIGLQLPGRFSFIQFLNSRSRELVR